MERVSSYKIMIFYLNNNIFLLQGSIASIVGNSPLVILY